MKKNLAIFFSVLGLFIAFGAVCLLLYFFKNKQSGTGASLLKAKMRIGMLLIGLTAVANTGCFPPVVACYMPAPYNEFELENMVYDYAEQAAVLTINSAEITTITGSLYGRKQTSYSFRIEDRRRQEIQRGDILPVDGEYDAETEKITFELGPVFVRDVYSLCFFACSQSEQGSEADPQKMYEKFIKCISLKVVRK